MMQNTLNNNLFNQRIDNPQVIIDKLLLLSFLHY